MNASSDFRIRIGVALLLGLVLRIPALDGGLWFDEIWTLVDFGRMPLGELLRTYGSDNNHPLYSILARCSMLIFGESPAALRLPALVFGILSIYEIARLALLLLDEEQATNAAFILAIASPHIWFSTNARGYTALLYFSLLATRYLVLLERDPTRLRIGFQGLFLALATWVHATAVMLALGQLAAVFFCKKEARGTIFKALLVAGALSLLMHAAILGEMAGFFLGSSTGEARVASTWSNPLWMLSEVARRLSLPLSVALVLALLGILALLLGLRRIDARARTATLMFVVPPLAGAAVLIALGRNLWPRFFFFELGAAILAVLAAIKSIAALSTAERAPIIEKVLSFGVILVCLVLLIRSGITGPKQDFVAAARRADELPSGRVVTVGLARMPMTRYLERDFREIEKAAELEAMLASGEVFVINTLPIFLEDREPDLLRLIEERGDILASFPGSLGGGEVVIWKVR